MKRSWSHRRRALVAVAAGSAAVVPWPGLSASAGGVVSAGASAEVIAQSLVSFVDGDYHFRLSTAAIGQTPSAIELADPTFLLAGGSAAVLVSTADGPGWRLAEGEAAYQSGGSSVEVVALETGAASVTTMTLEPGPDVNTFAPGSGVRDVDLVRATVPTDGSVTVSTEIALFVLVTAGEVAAGDTSIAAGATATFGGDTTLTNRAAEPAVVVVAVIGPTIDPAAPAPAESQPDPAPAPEPASAPAPAEATTTTTTIDPAAPAPAESQPDPAPEPASAPAPAEATTTTTTIDPMVADIDADGLTGADEELRGTDPNNADSDGDGLPDGFETFESGTNPLDADSDADGLNDRAELNDLGTNPSDEDSDDDGALDGDEFRAGTDPNDPASKP